MPYQDLAQITSICHCHGERRKSSQIPSLKGELLAKEHIQLKWSSHSLLRLCLWNTHCRYS